MSGEWVRCHSEPAPWTRQHAFRQFAELHQIFTISGILPAVSLRRERLFRSIMKPGAFTAGKEKGTPDADSAERIQFVGIVNNLRLQSGRTTTGTVTVGQHRPGDLLRNIRGKTALLQQRPDQLSPKQRMADTAF